MTTDTTQTEPTTGKYIGIWILTSIAASITIAIVDRIMATLTLDASSISGFTNSSYWFLAPPIEYAAWAVVIIVIYSAAGNLKVSKVIPWFFGLGSLGVIFSLVQTYNAAGNYGIALPIIFPITMIGSFVIAVMTVRWYFKTKKPRQF